MFTTSYKFSDASPSLPYTEATPLLGRAPYDVSKSCTDLIAQSYAFTYGLPVAITRCGNLYGGGDLNWSRIVPGTIRSCLRNERPIIRSDGKFVRDYLYIEDAVSGLMTLADKLDDPEVSGQAFNLSPEGPSTVLEVVDKIRELMGRQDLEPIILDEASDEIREQYLDCSRARDILGWSPGHSLDDGLKKTIDWYRQKLSG